jgi:hypothetical protein
MRRRGFGSTLVAVSSLLGVVCLAGPAQADTLPDAYTQIVNHQVPIQPDGASTEMWPGFLGLGRYYAGPNGLELRFSSSGSADVVLAVLGFDSVSYGTAIAGSVTTVGGIVMASVPSAALRSALTAAGAAGAPYVGQGIQQAVQDLILKNLCIGVTVPTGSLSGVLDRGISLVSANIAGLFQGASAPNISVWLQPCESSSGEADAVVPVYLPGVLGVVAAQPLAPIEGGSSGAQMFNRGDSAIFAASSIGGAWTQETTPGNATAIASSSTGVQMFIRGDSAVFARSGIGATDWVQETTPGNATRIAVGGDTQLFLRGDGAVFATSCIGCNWVQETVPGTATAIAASSTGVQMIITSDAAIWAKNGIGYGGWTQEVGSGNATAIAVGGDTQMFIRGDSAVFAMNGISNGGWVEETNPGNATRIAASSTGIQMFIRGDAAVFARKGIGTSWTQETSPGNAWAISVGGNTQMFARGDNAVFATSSVGGSWTQETSPGNAQAIAAG